MFNFRDLGPGQESNYCCEKALVTYSVLILHLNLAHVYFCYSV